MPVALRTPLAGHRAGTGSEKAAASAARARVDALVQRYQDASAQVDEAARALAAAFAAGADADVDEQEAAAQHRRANAVQVAQIRAVYAAGGPGVLTATIFGASSPADVLWRASTADRVLATVMGDASLRVVAVTDQLRLARRRARAADDATLAQAQALDRLQERNDEARVALAAARQTLAALGAQVRAQAAARAAAWQIAAAQRAAAASRRAALGPISALAIPIEYEQAYRAAATTCPGLDWTLLAGVGQVETGHGRNNHTSSAGAIGPMQFMPRTFAMYAVDGDHDGALDAWDPQDAIFSAAHYLCASAAAAPGGLGTATGVHTALLAYNHAEWYVDLVLAAQQAIQAAGT